MKSSLSRITLALMALLLCLATLMPAALAEPLSIQINAQITLEGTQPATAEAYVIRMTADDPSNPMPNGQKGGSYDLIITGAGSAVFPAMTFDSLGIYKYTIAEIPGTNPDCTYDTRTYQLTVSVVNSEKEGFDIEVALRENGKTEKTDAALFHNVYKTILPTPAPTTPPGKITATGVNDMWMYYVGGAAVLLVAAAVIVHFLRRKEDGSHEGN